MASENYSSTSEIINEYIRKGTYACYWFKKITEKIFMIYMVGSCMVHTRRLKVFFKNFFFGNQIETDLVK